MVGSCVGTGRTDATLIGTLGKKHYDLGYLEYMHGQVVGP